MRQPGGGGFAAEPDRARRGGGKSAGEAAGRPAPRPPPGAGARGRAPKRGSLPRGRTGRAGRAAPGEREGSRQVCRTARGLGSRPALGRAAQPPRKARADRGKAPDTTRGCAGPPVAPPLPPRALRPSGPRGPRSRRAPPPGERAEPRAPQPAAGGRRPTRFSRPRPRAPRAPGLTPPRGAWPLPRSSALTGRRLPCVARRGPSVRALPVEISIL